MRAGIIALQHESNTFASKPTAFADFEADHVLSGQAIREFMTGAHHEVGGFFAALDRAGATSVPIFSARALPGGTISRATFDRLLDLLFSALEQAGPLDGLLVAPHGAAVSEQHPDADGFWLTRLRERVGPNVPIVCTIDPHANLSQRMINACDATIAYRTNPHVDSRDRGIEAADLLLRTLRKEVHPRQSAVLLPLAINIERQRTAEPPILHLRQWADSLRAQPGVLSVSLVLGFPYADVPEMGSAVIVVTDAGKTSPGGPASEFAQHVWAHRQELIGVMISPAEAIERIADESGPVLLLDMGDNVGGGGPGDGTTLAHALHEHRVPDALMTIHDPESVQLAARAGIGANLALRMGGKTDERHGPPLETAVEVLSLHDGRFRESEVRHGGWADFDMGQVAVVRTPARLTIMLTSRRLFPVSAKQWTAFDIDPARYRVIVAKGVHAPVAAYEAICNRIIRVNTPGITTADMESLDYRNRRRPLFPFERDFVWPHEGGR